MILAITLTFSFSVVFFAIVLYVLFILIGCAPRDVLVRHPDSPVLITGVIGKPKVRAAAYSKQEKKLVDIGEIDVPEGWTLTKFDWASYVEKQNAEN